MKYRPIFLLFFLIMLFYQCQQEKYILKDGYMVSRIVVQDSSGLLNPGDSTKSTPVPNATVIFQSQDYNRKYVFHSDSNGIVEAEKLIASSYEISAEYEFNISTVLIGALSLQLYQSRLVIDTIKTHKMAISPIVINEIYSSGPVNNSLFFYDQYIELYNRSEEIQYLDGLLLTRAETNPDNDPFIDIWDYVSNIYVYQFPGNPGGMEYPIDPKQFVVIAVDAFDHSQSMPGAVNLEHADWEFFNQLGSDYDNPNVPNLLNVNPERPREFLISLTSDAVILAQGDNYWQVDKFIRIKLTSVMDGVEYKSSGSTPKHLTRRIDSGYIAGVTKYSGKSRERVLPGKDTNNSSNDFQVILSPTPGQ